MADVLKNHLALSQGLKLSQKMVMSLRIQQALKLLQMPLEELAPFIEEQITLNPLLEIEEKKIASNPPEETEEKPIEISDSDLSILSRLDDEWSSHFGQTEGSVHRLTGEQEERIKFQEDSIIEEPSLNDYLLKQAEETFETKEELEYASILIGYIDHFGFLETPLDEIAAFHHLEKEKLSAVLSKIQQFEPVGVGAATIKDSFLIQLRSKGKENTLAFRLVSECFEEMLLHQIKQMRKKTNASFQEIEACIENEIAKLDFHPGGQFGKTENFPIFPDVILREEEGQLIVEVDRETALPFKINHRYLKMLEDPAVSKETKRFIKEHLFSARWLARNLEQRYSTLHKIAAYISKKQQDFFLDPKAFLHPLTMKAVAEELGIHESTVARAVSNKYLHSPRGLFPLRYFFTSKLEDDISSNEAKEWIASFIRGEDKKKPLSDETLSSLLKEKGISCARRTVAKYRSALGIGSTQQRRRQT